MEIQRQTYTVKDLMELLEIGRDSAYKLVETGYFPCYKIGRKYLIPKNSFHNWIENLSPEVITIS